MVVVHQGSSPTTQTPKPTRNVKISQKAIQIVISFLIGGAIISGIPLLLEKADETFAAILYSFPFSFLPVIFIIYFFNDKDVDTIQEFSVQSTLGLLLLILFTASFSIIIGLRNSRTSSNPQTTGELATRSRRFHTFSALGICLGIWAVGAVLMFMWIKYKQTGTVRFTLKKDSQKIGK